jgi:hypothetical protein
MVCRDRRVHRQRTQQCTSEGINLVIKLAACAAFGFREVANRRLLCVTTCRAADTCTPLNFEDPARLGCRPEERRRSPHRADPFRVARHAIEPLPEPLQRLLV